MIRKTRIKRIKNRLPTSLWEVDKKVFIGRYKVLTDKYGIDNMKAALKYSRYDEIRSDLEKLLILL